MTIDQDKVHRSTAAWDDYAAALRDMEQQERSQDYWDKRRALTKMAFGDTVLFRNRVIDLVTGGRPELATGTELFNLDARARANLERLCAVQALPWRGMTEQTLRAHGIAEVDPRWYEHTDLVSCVLPEGWRYEPVNGTTTYEAWIVNDRDEAVIGVIFRDPGTGSSDQLAFPLPQPVQVNAFISAS